MGPRETGQVSGFHTRDGVDLHVPRLGIWWTDPIHDSYDEYIHAV